MNPAKTPEGPAESWEAPEVPVGDPVNPAESPEGPVESWESPNWAVDGPVNPTGPPEGLAESWDASLVDPVNPREPPEGPPESWESSFGVGPEVPRVGSSGMCSEGVWVTAAGGLAVGLGARGKEVLRTPPAKVMKVV